MSSVNLHEFNLISKRHNYFMTNNRKNGFPSLNENSILLRKILSNKDMNSTGKNLRYTEANPRRIVRFTKPENVSYLDNSQSPIIVRKNKYNPAIQKTLTSNYHNNLYNSEIKNYISPYRVNPQIRLDQNLIDSHLIKIPIKIYNRNSNSSDLFNSRFFSNTSNYNDSESEMRPFNFKGRKMFPSNSFYNLKSSDTINSPSKDYTNNINKETELFRSTEELRKKRDEIIQRKMKRESSAIKREIMRREKQKEIKNQKLDLPFSRNTASYKTDLTEDKDDSHIINKIKVIPLSKKGINDNIKKLNIRYNINKGNINNNNSSMTSSKIKTKKNRLYNYKINSINIPKKNNININNFDNVCNLIKNNNNCNNNNNNNSLYHKKNKIYVGNNNNNSLPKSLNYYSINNKIKENLDYIRKSNNTGMKCDMNTSEQLLNNSKNVSTDKHNNPYKFITSKKKFIEDFSSNNLELSSKDKKVTIRVTTLPNKNEFFLGKTNTKDKLKMQRIISLVFIDNIKKKGNNKRKNIRYFKNNNISQKTKEVNPLTSIKEEEEKSKLERKKRFIKYQEKKMEAKEKPFYQKNARMKYLKRSENNK